MLNDDALNLGMVDLGIGHCDLASVDLVEEGVFLVRGIGLRRIRQL